MVAALLEAGEGGGAALEVVAVLLALAGPAALARAATARRAVDLALVAWPLTLAPFALYDCRLDAKLLGAVSHHARGHAVGY